MIAISILTAQGYLSFTPAPDGKTCTVEYRPTQGEWETIALPGLEEAIAAIVQEALGGSGTAPTPPPVYAVPGNIPPAESAAYVSEIKNWLLSQGKNLSGPCGAFEIVANVAWGIQILNTGCGLLSKPDGNNCQSYSTDVVAYKDYTHGSTRIVDILGDAGGENNATWQEKGSEENVAMDRWRPPVDPATAAGRAVPTRAGRLRLDDRQ